MAAPARILVTGAGGVVGRRAARAPGRGALAGRTRVPALRAAFPAAVLIGAGREAAIPGMDESHRLDLLDPAGLDAVIAAARPAAVLPRAAPRAAAVRGVDESHRLDLLAPAGLDAVIAAARPDAVLHLAAQSNVPA